MTRELATAARLLLLAATLLVLLATSAPPCTQTSITATFQASGTCGPPGTVVLSADRHSAGPAGTPIDADGVAWLPRAGTIELGADGGPWWCTTSSFRRWNWTLDGDAAVSPPVLSADGGSFETDGTLDPGTYVAHVSCRTSLADGGPVRVDCESAGGTKCEATLVPDDTPP